MENTVPNYTFEKPDGSFETIEMKMSELDAFKDANPTWMQCLGPVAIGDPWKLGVTKPPSDFSKYILGKVKEKNPLASNIERTHHITREW